MNQAEKKQLMLRHWRVPRTTNEVIKRIFIRDVKKGQDFIINERGHMFYTHLNKLTAPMAREGLISCVGTKEGEGGRQEKVWVRLDV